METSSHSSPLNTANSKPSTAAVVDPNIVAGASPDAANTFDAGSTTATATADASAAAGSSSSSATGGHLSSLKSLNKASYKISKQLSRNPNPVQRAPLPQPSTPTVTDLAGGGGAPPQPPVYNIDKDDFRDVVQKLTGSPAHHQVRAAAPQPAPPMALAAPPAPAATSRLHRIRPPPLAHLVPWPPTVVPVPPPAAMAPVDPWTRPPLSPLPPLPLVIAAAESPISAYMRRLHAGLAQSSTASAAPALPSLSSPLGFGCLPSPRTAYQMLMAPGLVFPTSPGVPSPRVAEP